MDKLSEHFKRSEFACRCMCGFDTVDSALIDILEWLRLDLNAPIIINSGCRCVDHNSRVGGTVHSQHTKARAADIRIHGIAPTTIYQILDETFQDEVSLGLYEKSGFVHVDTRTDGGKRWKES